MGVKEGVLHIQLVDRPLSRGRDAEDNLNGSRLDDGAEGLIVVDAVALGEATDDPASLSVSQCAIRVELMPEVHLPVTMLAPGGRGTRRQVFLSMSALYLSAIATWVGSRICPQASASPSGGVSLAGSR
jgi:hypothetical protein